MNENGNRIWTGQRRSAAPKAKPCTEADVRAIVTAETAKIHEFYLNQIPPFVARMIQDALMSYGLIVPPPSDIAPAPDAAEVAQPAEQRPRNAQVDGSNPSLSSAEGSES